VLALMDASCVVEGGEEGGREGGREGWLYYKRMEGRLGASECPVCGGGS